MSDSADYAPPVDYALYGLGSAAWADSRWLEFVEGEIARPSWAVWLGHGSRRDPARVIVGSASRPRLDAMHAGLPGDPPAHVAFAVGLHMIGYTLPDDSVPRPEGLVRAIANEMHRQATSCSDWAEIGWTVDGVEVLARVWKFAGFWAAFTDELGESYVMAIGTEVDPDGLNLDRVVDGTPYGFELGAELGYGAARGNPLPVVRPDRQQFHPDHLRLLGAA